MKVNIKKWLEIRDELDYTDDAENIDNPDDYEWEALPITKNNTKYGHNYIYIEPKQGFWRINETGDEFYNHTPAKKHKK